MDFWEQICYYLNKKMDVGENLRERIDKMVMREVKMRK